MVHPIWSTAAEQVQQRIFKSDLIAPEYKSTQTKQVSIHWSFDVSNQDFNIHIIQNILHFDQKCDGVKSHLFKVKSRKKT